MVYYRQLEYEGEKLIFWQNIELMKFLLAD